MDRAKIDDFWQFVIQRHWLWELRSPYRHDGTIPDTIPNALRSYRYTNIFRILDRGSQELIDRIETYDKESALFRVLAWRAFGRSSTFDAIEGCLDGWGIDQDRALQAIEAIQGPVFTGAYQTATLPGCGPDGSSVAQRHVMRLAAWAEDETLKRSVMQATTLEQVYRAMRLMNGVGDFMAWQFALDVDYWHIGGLERRDFVVAGPGARAGLKLLGTGNGRHWDDVIRMLTREAPPELMLDRLKVEPSDVEHALCEYSKFHRIREALLLGKRPGGMRPFRLDRKAPTFKRAGRFLQGRKRMGIRE